MCVCVTREGAKGGRRFEGGIIFCHDENKQGRRSHSWPRVETLKLENSTLEGNQNDLALYGQIVRRDATDLELVVLADGE